MLLRDVRNLVRDRVKVHGCRGYAKLLGLSPSYVSDICNGRRLPGPKFLADLGLRRVTRYVPIRLTKHGG